MTVPIEFFFDVVSPFGWFSAERVGGWPRTRARTVAWRPAAARGDCHARLAALLQTPVCTKNLNASVLVMKSAKDAA